MRLDAHLVEKGLAPSRSKAAHLVRSGAVFVNGVAVLKTSRQVREGDAVEVRGTFRYVGRGGYKLEGFLQRAGLAATGLHVLDVGCSTGGFSDCLLQHGAASVLAVDAGMEVLDPALRAHPRLRFIGGVNAANPADLDRAAGAERFDLITVDLTNVPLEVVLDHLAALLVPGGRIAALFKPPYEGGRGVVDRAEALELAAAFESRIAAGGRLRVLFRAFSDLPGRPNRRGTQELFYLLGRAGE